jgi:hypothetical protein
MGYRIDRKPIKPEDMLPTFAVRNGSTMRLAFKCYYVQHEENFSPDVYDNLEWHDDKCPEDEHHHNHHCPKPDVYIDVDDLEPIDLPDCDYDEVVVTYEDDSIAQHLTTDAWIDENTPSIVRMFVSADIPNFSDKPKQARFTIFLKRTIHINELSKDIETADTLCHGMIVILPGKPVD